MEKSWRRWQGRKGHRKGARERELHGGNTKKIHNDIETRSEVCNKTRKRRGKERISKMVGEKKESGKMEGELIRIGVDSKSRWWKTFWPRALASRGNSRGKMAPTQRENAWIRAIVSNSKAGDVSAIFDRLPFLVVFLAHTLSPDFRSRKNRTICIEIEYPANLTALFRFVDEFSNKRVAISHWIIIYSKFNEKDKHLLQERNYLCCHKSHCENTRGKLQTKSFVKRKLRREENFYR